MRHDPMQVAKQALRIALANGARQAAIGVSRATKNEVQWRDSRLESLEESTSMGLSIDLYVDDRYSSNRTSDLRPDALESFIANAVAMTRHLAKDPYRSLPDPSRYGKMAAVDLEQTDPAYARLTPQERQRRARDLEAAARQECRGARVISATSFWSDNTFEACLVDSNGFAGQREGTTFYHGVDLALADDDGRRPRDGSYGAARHLGDLPSTATVAQEAAQRAQGRLGARKLGTRRCTMVLENRAGGRLLWHLLAPLSGHALQQKRSFFEGKQGQTIASAALTIVDEPHLPRGLGSRLFDTEGLATRTLPLIEGGVLRNFYIDTYYAKKLGVNPTTGSQTNLRFGQGKHSRKELIGQVENGIFVTGFLGGNSNATTGDFSLGVSGHLIRNGALAEPVAEMNIAGNHLAFWQHLTAVGNDPYPYSSLMLPTMVLEDVQFSGS